MREPPPSPPPPTSECAPRRPRVGISACLLGERVRHDGRDKLDAALLAALGGLVEWVPVCPEMDAGMGVPREPVELVVAGPAAESALDADASRAAAHSGAAARARLVGARSRRDWTEALLAAARRRLADVAPLHGFILMTRSPSCGLGTAAVHDGRGAVLRTGDGLFAAALRAMDPSLPVAEAASLADAAARALFVDRVLARAARSR